MQAGVPSNLKNPDSTGNYICYANSSLQSFFNLPGFDRYLQSKTSTENEQQRNLADRLLNLYNTVRAGQKGDASPVVDMVMEGNPSGKSYQQAANFIERLFGILEQGNADAYKEQLNMISVGETTPINTIFQNNFQGYFFVSSYPLGQILNKQREGKLNQLMEMANIPESGRAAYIQKINNYNEYCISKIIYWNTGHYVSEIKIGQGWYSINDLGKIEKIKQPRIEIQKTIATPRYETIVEGQTIVEESQRITETVEFLIMTDNFVTELYNKIKEIIDVV